MKEWLDGKSYAKTAKKVELEVKETLLKEFVRYVTEKKSKPKSSGLSFEVLISSLSVDLSDISGEFRCRRNSPKKGSN